VIDVDARTFEREVIERSLQVLVVVDFWATWCGPCKTLGPELERRAQEAAGSFVLAKVDIDRSPELAQALRVQAVPTVLVVSGGRIVDGFQGALPPEEIDRFLQQVAPGSVASRVDRRLEGILAMKEAGRTDEALGHLRELIRDQPDHDEGRLALAELLIDTGSAEQAREVLEPVAETPEREDRLKALRARLDFADHGGDLERLEERVRAAPDDLGAQLELGRARIAARDHAAGLEQLLEVVRGTDEDLKKEAKQAMLEAFDILGLEDPVANEYRFKLSLELFS
jgi:putative thioredoxin